MSKPSKPRSSNLLISSVGDSPVSLSRSLGAASDKMTSAGSGLSLLESFATCDLDGCSLRTSQGSSPATGPKWKTLQGTLFGNQECRTYSESWPAAGMTRNGIAYRLPRSVPRTCVTGRSSLPTLRSSERNSYQRDRGEKGKERLTLMGRVKLRTLSARDGTARGASDPRKRLAQGHQPGLHDQIRFLPTLRGSDGKSGPQQQRKRGMGGSHHGGNLAGFLPTLTASMMTLADMEQAKYSGNDPNRPKYRDAGFLPTLQARDFRSGKTRTSYGNSRPLNEVVPPDECQQSVNRKTKSADSDGGPLNPTWCEWYQGFPIGWTELEDSGTLSSRKSLSGSGPRSSKRKHSY
jgi:hypothetical protein